jgi:hypothetical protein
MSWVFLPAPGADYLPAPTSWDGAPVSPSRSTPTASVSSCSDNATAFCTPSLSGTTLSPSTVTLGEDTSTSSAEGSPARTSPAPAKEPVWTELARAYGSKCSELLARSGLRLSSRKTLRVFALEDSGASSQDLPAWGMSVFGVCLELGTSVRRTSANACGSLLPTPTCAGNEDSPSMQKWPAHRALQVMMATPTASGSDARNTNRPSARATRAALMLPTPTASSYGSNQGGAAGRVGKVRHNLEKTAQLAGLLPTPTARDWKSGAASEATHARHNLEKTATQAGVVSTGGPFIALREWMMAMPLGWTSVEPLPEWRMNEWFECFAQFGSQVRSQTSPQELVRMVSPDRETASASPRSQPSEQRSSQLPDTVYNVSPESAHLGRRLGEGSSTRRNVSGVPISISTEEKSQHEDLQQTGVSGRSRKAGGTAPMGSRVDRIRATGNAQVCLVAALAWSVLSPLVIPYT